MGDKLKINWDYFSLEQINSSEEPDWKVWEQPKDRPSRGMKAFRAAEAARNQGEPGFSSFHYALLRTRHQDHKDISDFEVLKEVAQEAGLDMNRFEKDFEEAKGLERLGESHTRVVEKYNAFGTPTLIFPGDQAVFLKMSPPPAEESLAVFNEIRAIVQGRSNILEIKRP